jgi:hypothetical protein
LEDFAQTLSQTYCLLKNGHPQVNAQGRPKLALHRMGTDPQKSSDAPMLLDPSEEQFDLPAAPIKVGHRLRGHRKIVGQQAQGFLAHWIAHSHPAQRLRGGSAGMRVCQFDFLIAAQARRFIHRKRMPEDREDMTWAKTGLNDRIANGTPMVEPDRSPAISVVN